MLPSSYWTSSTSTDDSMAVATSCPTRRCAFGLAGAFRLNGDGPDLRVTLTRGRRELPLPRDCCMLCRRPDSEACKACRPWMHAAIARLTVASDGQFSLVCPQPLHRQQLRSSLRKRKAVWLPSAVAERCVCRCALKLASWRYDSY